MKTIISLMLIFNVSVFANSVFMEKQMKNFMIQPYKSKKVFHFLDSETLRLSLDEIARKNDFLCEAGTATFVKFKGQELIKFQAGCLDKMYHFKNVYLYFSFAEEAGRETSYKLLGSRVK